MYKGITYTGDSSANRLIDGIGFSPDFALIGLRAGSTGEKFLVHDKIRGAGSNKYLVTDRNSQE